MERIQDNSPEDKIPPEWDLSESEKQWFKDHASKPNPYFREDMEFE